MTSLAKNNVHINTKIYLHDNWVLIFNFFLICLFLKTILNNLKQNVARVDLYI